MRITRRPDCSVTDGGGVRGLSSIMILKHIMDGVNEKRDPDDRLEPCQVFDMIGGTSTGG
jgi:patatin-like phospholipase/acyl hydrolase